MGSKSSSADPTAPVRVQGTLGRRVVRKGTGSEHESWVLDTSTHGQLLLKRLGANPFELGDAPGEVGASVEVEGYLRDNEFRYASVRKR